MESTVYGEVVGYNFNLDTDVSPEVAEAIRNQYVELQNMFSTIMNKNLEQINLIWDKYKNIEVKEGVIGNDKMLSDLALITMGLQPGADYNDWLNKWVKETLQFVLAYSRINGYLLELKYVLSDNKEPLIIGEYIRNPKWFVYFKKTD